MARGDRQASDALRDVDIAQGINFPVSSVFLPLGMCGKARVRWKSVHGSSESCGSCGSNRSRQRRRGWAVRGTDRDAMMEFVSRNTGALVSRLVVLLDELAAKGSLAQLSEVLWMDQWEDFRCYIAHLWAEKKDLDAVLADSEQLLRQTYGYTSMRNDPGQRRKADALLDATQSYARDSPTCRKGSRNSRIPPGSRRKVSGRRWAAFAIWRADSPLPTGRRRASSAMEAEWRICSVSC